VAELGDASDLKSVQLGVRISSCLQKLCIMLLFALFRYVVTFIVIIIMFSILDKFVFKEDKINWETNVGIAAFCSLLALL
jgi:hypothetical protein